MSRVLAAQAIVEAVTHLLVKETGPNTGPQIDRYNKAAGAAVGSKWCCSFVFTMYDDASRALGVFNPLPRTASVENLWARTAVEWHTMSPTRGSIAVHLETGHNHCAIWLASSLTHAATIEGNTSEIGSRDGNSVQVQRRPHSYWTGYIDIGRAMGDA